MSWRGVNERYQNIMRYREIGEVLLKHGFRYLTEQLDLLNLIPLRKRLFKKDKEAKRRLPRAARIRMVLEELGPTFVKLGQMLSIRPDIVPPDIIRELERLQDEVAPLPFHLIEEEIEEELGRPVDEVFEHIDEVPLAAASIGQVHAGKLRDSRRVVVKVQRPGVEGLIKRDLGVLMNLARILEQRVPASAVYDPVGIVEEFTRSITKELDYRLEGRNAERFRRNFTGDKTIYIPEVYWEVTTRHVLTMEMVEGIKVSHVEELEERGYDRHEIAYNGARAILKQVIVDGFFHADPHPGNILIREDGSIAFLDFGMVGHLPGDLTKELIDLFRGIIKRDAERILSALQKIGIGIEGAQLHGLKEEIVDLIDEYYYKPIGEIEIGPLMAHITELATRYNIKMPMDFVLLGKSILTIEGVGRRLDPQFHIGKVLEPFMKEFLGSWRYRERVLRATAGEVLNMAGIAFRIPKKMDKLLEKVEKGELEMKMRMDELRTLITRMDVLANRMILGMVTTGIIIGSSLIMQTERVPTIWGFPLIGVVGYLLAGFFGIFIIIWLLRSGRF